MNLHEQILKEAIDGRTIDHDWVALQMVLLYRQHLASGLPHEDALKMAKQDMLRIKDEALRIRRRQAIKQYKQHGMENFAPWFVIILGIMAAYGWWQMWE